MNLPVPRFSSAPRRQRLASSLLTSLAAALLLSACGGGGGSDSGATTAVATPTPAASVRISGAAIKGPVAGATVCAYPITAGAKGSPAGTCTTTGSDGSYDLQAPATADILLEATGGTFLDEATQVQASLPADRPMTSVVNGTAGNVTAYLTPLTTLATNAARRAGGLSTAAFQQQSTVLKAVFGLDAALDLLADRPVVSGTPNSYGLALAAISRLSAGGLSLRDILGTASPTALAAAFQQAYAGAGGAIPPTTPTTPTIPTTPTTPTAPTAPTTPTTPSAPDGPPQASGTVAVTGGPVASFSPDAAGFVVSLDKTDITYRFEKQVSFPVGSGGQVGTSTAYISVTRRSQGEGGPLASTIVTASLAPELGFSGLKVKSCAGECGITVSASAGTSHPVTVNLNQVDVGGWMLNGSLTGNAPGASYAFADLPRTTAGSLRVNGVSSEVTTGDVVRGAGPNGGGSRQVTLRLQNGGMVTVAEVFDATGNPIGTRTAGYLSPPSTANLCANACGYVVTEDANSLTVTFNNSSFEGGIVLDGSATLRKTTGSLTSPTLGSFTPVSDGIGASNDSRTLTFSTLGTQAQGGISLVAVRHRGGQVEEMSVTTGIGAGVYQCFREAAAFIGVPACQGVSVSADGRSVTFAATAVGGGFGANRQSAVLNGTLTARAF